jgi:hypothetical protein
MSRFGFNDEEDGALQGLSLLAQVIYLRAFKPNMDFASGVTGKRCRVDYQLICDAAGFVPDPGSTKRRWLPTKEEVRAAIAELERAGLLVECGSGAQRGHVKRLPLADTGSGGPC